jgi:hypothetical protein
MVAPVLDDRYRQSTTTEAKAQNAADAALAERAAQPCKEIFTPQQHFFSIEPRSL